MKKALIFAGIMLVEIVSSGIMSAGFPIQREINPEVLILLLHAIIVMKPLLLKLYS